MNKLLLAGLFVPIVAIAACSSSQTPTLHPGPSPTPAGPERFAVTAGSANSTQAYQALTFYPSAITIDAGDSITWTVTTDEPHTISFPLPGATPIAPTDPSAQAPAGGTTFDGTVFDSSGFLLGGKTYTLTFPKPGTYAYYSVPQYPIAQGTVVVQAAGTAYPLTQSAIASSAGGAISADLASAMSSVATVPYVVGSNSIAAGISPATSGGASSTVMRFLAGPTETDNLTTTIPAGTTLTFKNLSNNVPHSVTIPAAGGSLPSGPPFQPATGGTTYDGTQLVGSGPIGPGGTFAVTFTTAGTYTYACLFHAGEGMNGTIVVTPAGA